MGRDGVAVYSGGKRAGRRWRKGHRWDDGVGERDEGCGEGSEENDVEEHGEHGRRITTTRSGGRLLGGRDRASSLEPENRTRRDQCKMVIAIFIQAAESNSRSHRYWQGACMTFRTLVAVATNVLSASARQ